MDALAVTFDRYACREYKHFRIYTELARVETEPDFRRILERLALHEKADFEFWRRHTSRQSFEVGSLYLFWMKLMRRMLGLAFTAKFLERSEKEVIEEYENILGSVDAAMRDKIRKIIAAEKEHEKEFIGQIQEDKVRFMGSIVLGLNDALIELTGALFGFSFVFGKPHVVAAAGLITGIAGSLSMASSAFMQARYEHGKDAKSAAFYTGLSYFAIVILLVLPFFVFSEGIVSALTAMFCLIFLIILAASYYTAVVFDRKFKQQVMEMMAASLGVAVFASMIGFAFRRLTGIEF